MRISEAVGAPQKLVSKAACVEAQRNNGCRQPVWVSAMMLATCIVAILVIVAGMAYFVGFPIICGKDAATPEDETLAAVSAVGETRGAVPHSAWSLWPQADSPLLARPAAFVLLKHTAGQRCSGLLECTPVLRAIQELQWQRFDQPEISYNFAIDSDGNIYEGRGWNGSNPSTGVGWRCTLEVALIGNYMEHNVTREASSALRGLLEHAVEKGALSADYRLLAHNQLAATLSPGRWALREVADWPHRCLTNCREGVLCGGLTSST